MITSSQGSPDLQPRIHRLGLERQDTEDGLVDAPKGLAGDELGELLDPVGVLVEQVAQVPGGDVGGRDREQHSHSPPTLGS